MGSLAFRIGLILGIMALLGLGSASPASAYTVTTHWDFNKNYVDAEAYHCSGSQCSSVTSQFFSENTGSSSDVSINYNVGDSCGSGTHYTAFYFYKQCFIPMEGYVWSTCAFSYSDDIDFYKKTDCKAEILSLSAPSSGQPGQAIQITADVKSHLVNGLSPPDYVPSARKAEYYSGDVLVSVNVKDSGSSIVYTSSKTLSIYKEASKNAVFSWTPSVAGSYTVEVTTDVTDCKCSSSVKQSKTKSITISPANTPPVIEGIPDKTINVGQTISQIDLYNYASDAQDSDSALSFSIQSESDTSVIDCYITGNRYVQCGNGLKSGYSDIIVKVVDTGGLSDTDAFRITVSSVNTPPVLEGIPDSTISIGQTINQIDLYNYASDAQDPDTSLSFSIQYESDTAVIDCYITGNRYVQCGQAQKAGYSDITVQVTDTGGLSDTDTFRITVSSVNTPPVLDGIPDKTINVGQTISQIDLYDYASDSQDPDSSLSFSIQSETDTSVIDCFISSNRYVQCGTGQKAGYSDITVQVTDTGGLSDTDTFRVSVTAANTPPVIEGIPDKTIQVGQTISQIDLYNYASDAQDADSALVFVIDSESDTSVIDCYVTGNRYLGCYASYKVGYSDMIVRVTDTGGLYDTDGFRITVQSTPPVNTPPVLEGLPDLSLQVSQTISLLDLYQYAFDSQDSDSELDFSIDSESDPGVIDCYITGNRYLGCGQAQKTGSSEIILRVTDTGGLYDTDAMRITVQAPEEHNPVLNSVGITPSNPKDSDDLVCTAQVSDQDGNLNRVEFRWYVEGGLEKTRTIYVSGSSADAQDTLGSLSSDKGEQVKCEASVYDSTGRSDNGYDIVEIEGWDCGVDVYSLEIIDNEKIRFRLRNTGAAQEDISWTTYVNGVIMDEREITLDSGEWELVDKSYDFNHGEYLVKVKATAGCGDTDSETVLHEVDGGGDEERPQVDYISITPSDPQEDDDLTCRVDVSDDDGDLEKVRFSWFIEGNLEETRTEYVSGSSDSAEDTLDSGQFQDGDEVECEATVYDEEGNTETDSERAVIGGGDGECGLDVSNLEIVDNNKIRFKLRNTGEHEETITWRIFVEFEEIEEGSITLDEDDYEIVEESFNFGSSGDYYVKVKATAGCGSTDWDSVFYEGGGACQNKYLDEYRCNGVWRERKYQNSDCSIIWLNWESCPQGCSGGSCIGVPGNCGTSIQRFEYQSNVLEGRAIPVILEAKNTGASQATITLSFFVDGVLKESFPSSISPSLTTSRTFYYYPTLGTHQLMVKSESSCGSSDSRTAVAIATKEGQPYDPELPTAVSIYPSAVDTGLCESKFITIDIHSSKDQVFTIQTSGIPSEWVSYQSQTVVKQGDRKLFIYVGPKEAGTKTLSIKVRAEAESKDYFQDVSVYTAGACQGTAAAQKGDWMTGLASAFGSWWGWLLIIIVVFGIVLVAAVFFLRPDTEYYEKDYPYLAKQRTR